MDSELQIGLAALGVAAIIGIVAYNKWQERKQRRQAELAFKSDHPDVLLESRDGAPAAGERVEPSWNEAETDRTEVPPSTVPPAGSGAAAQGTHLRRATPGLPEAIDSRIDCVIRIESIEPLDAPRLWAAQHEQLQGISKPVRWFAFDDSQNLWRVLTPNTAGDFHWFCAAMQMADRRGAMSENDFTQFSTGVQQIADQFLAVPAGVPARADALRLAVDLDEFCATVDVQVGVNLVANAQPFAGTKIRALAEAHGMTLGDDGAFHARDDHGNSLYTLRNMEPALFTAEEMRQLHTNGLTLLIDVPNVAHGVTVFERMMQQAVQMAEALNGAVVDDNRAAFGQDAAMMIRSQIQQFQAQMTASDLTPGSPLAARLFSA